LSKELRIGQQLIMKHLGVIEEHGLVTSRLESSPNGPRRKKYFLAKSVSVVVDLAPYLFNSRVLSFESLPGGKSSASTVALMGRIDRIKGSVGEEGKIVPFAGLLSEIDMRIRGLESERSVLLYVRSLAMKEAAGVVGRVEKGMDEKRVLYYVLSRHSRNVAEIARSLSLREEEVRRILGDLKRIL
jgi:predicted transcriptional regulator